jgi:hypothetical protein
LNVSCIHIIIVYYHHILFSIVLVHFIPNIRTEYKYYMHCTQQQTSHPLQNITQCNGTYFFINSYSCKRFSETAPFHLLQQCSNLLRNSLSNNSHLLCNNSRILCRNIDLLSTTVEPCIISQKLVLSSLFEKLRDARDETLVCKKRKPK